MRRVLRKLASLRLTVFGMITLGIGAALNYDNPVSTPVWVLVAPLSLLALNLFAAILTNPRINRRGGLLVFHVGLLLIAVLVAIGRLTYMEGRIELVEGQPFAAEDVIDLRAGLLHRGGMETVQFIQGPYTVDYTSGMTRGPTRSHVALPDGRGGWEQRVIGDHTPLVIDGYRFYTTFNKGFAAIVTWMPEGGEPVTGAIHMPSYPLFEHRQANRWILDDGREIRFWLQVETGMDPEGDWRLEPARTPATLVLRDGERRIELAPGQSASIEGGVLRYERPAGWMGYKVFYDPTLSWLFIVAFMTVFGLAAHLWRKVGTVQTSAAAQEEGQVLRADRGLPGGIT
jgi:cytochrome c biogenesis protein ResB